MRKIFLLVSILIITVPVVITIVDMFLVGVVSLYFKGNGFSEKAIVEKENRIDFQRHNECSGYSTAYLLRHFGFEADGLSVYEKIPNKMNNGYVYPKYLKKVLETHGIKTRFSVTNLNALKHEIDRGNPVIVLIRIRPDKNWLHYVPVVGYDKDHIYLAESLPEYANSIKDKYNRTLSTKEFLKLWNTSMFKMPFYTHIMYSRMD